MTKDHHTKVISEKGETLQYRGTTSGDITVAAFKEQDSIKELNTFFNLFFNKNYQNISDSLLHGKGEKTLNGQVEWCQLNDSVGYIHIYSFTDFAPKGFTRTQQIDSVYEAMEKLSPREDKEAIVVDVSFNFGGL